MNPTRAQLAALGLISAALLLLWLLLDWSYTRGRSDLYALMLQLRLTADSALKLCPIPGAH